MCGRPTTSVESFVMFCCALSITVSRSVSFVTDSAVSFDDF